LQTFVGVKRFRWIFLHFCFRQPTFVHTGSKKSLRDSFTSAVISPSITQTWG